jgi:uncharacterized Zn-finger protein
VIEGGSGGGGGGGEVDIAAAVAASNAAVYAMASRFSHVNAAAIAASQYLIGALQDPNHPYFNPDLSALPTATSVIQAAYVADMYNSSSRTLPCPSSTMTTSTSSAFTTQSQSSTSITIAAPVQSSTSSKSVPATVASSEEESSGGANSTMATNGTACPVCSKVLKSRMHLQRHVQQIHESGFRFFCEVCHKGFRRKDNLKCHMRIHSGEQPYKCSYCSKMFRFKSGYSFHMKNRHPNEPTQ